MNTLTVAEFKKFLNTLPDDMKMFVSSDEEGNNYSTITTKFGTEIFKKDNSMIIYPGSPVDITDIAPLWSLEDED